MDAQPPRDDVTEAEPIGEPVTEPVIEPVTEPVIETTAGPIATDGGERAPDGDAPASATRKAPRPFSAYERMLAWRYLRSRRKEAFISVIAGFSFIGIMLGVATLVIVMAVMNGFRAELLDRILGLNGHMVVQPIERPLDDYEVVAARIESAPGVIRALPMVEGQALASGNIGAGIGALVRGLSMDSMERLGAVSDNIVEGDLTGFAAGDQIAIGTRMAENLGLALGDRLTIVTPEGDVTPFGVSPRVKSYPVGAIFEMGMSEYDASIVFMPLTEAQLYFNSEGVVQTIEIFVEEPDEVDAMRDVIEEAAQRPLFVVTWQQRNASFFAALEVERNVMFMILTLIVIVAALNIVSGLIMLVKDKGRDIAILRTMGATRGAILRVFLMTGSAIGVVGTLAGLLLGLVVTLNIDAIQTFFQRITGAEVWDPTVRFLSQIPADMDAGETLSILAMALGLSFLATIFPAWRAARLDPVDALRYE